MSIQPSHEAFTNWDVADRLRKSLRVCHMEQQEMADYLGVSRNTVSGWVNGARTPDTRTLRLWAMRTGASFNWLKDGTPAPDDDGGGEELPKADLVGSAAGRNKVTSLYKNEGTRMEDAYRHPRNSPLRLVA